MRETSEVGPSICDTKLVARPSDTYSVIGASLLATHKISIATPLECLELGRYEVGRRLGSFIWRLQSLMQFLFCVFPLSCVSITKRISQREVFIKSANRGGPPSEQTDVEGSALCPAPFLPGMAKPEQARCSEIFCSEAVRLLRTWELLV